MFSLDAVKKMPVSTLLALVVCALLATSHVEAKTKKKTSIVSGMVLSMQNEPLAGVALKLEPSDGDDPASTATTNTQGEFSIKTPVGEYTLHLSKEGFAPFTKAISIDGRRKTLRVQMLDASMGRRNVAIDAYNRAVEALKAEDSAAAIRHLEESAEADPTFLEPRDLLAELQTGSAVAMSKEAYNEGARAVHAGEMDKAVESFQKALELNPDLAEAHASLATILYNREQLEEALAATDRALALNPQDTSSLRVRVLVHEAAGDRAKADTAIKAYAAVTAEGAIELLSTKAEFDFKAGRRDEAAIAWLNVLGIEPDLPEAHYKLGLVYSDQDTAKARIHLERFIALAPTAPEVATAKDLLATF